MFFITCFTAPYLKSAWLRARAATRPRTFGYFSTLERTEEALKSNEGGMDECLFDYALVEEFGEGVHPESLSMRWYQYNEGTWEPCEDPRPTDDQSIFNYAMG